MTTRRSNTEPWDHNDKLRQVSLQLSQLICHCISSIARGLDREAMRVAMEMAMEVAMEVAVEAISVTLEERQKIHSVLMAH